MNFYKIAIAIITIVLGFSSCINDNFEKEFYTDGYIVTKIVGGDTLHGLEIIVQSNISLTDVNVYPTNNSNQLYDMEKLNSVGTYFEYSVEEFDYTETVEEIGELTFEMTDYEDDMTIKKDFVTTKSLDIPNFKECYFDIEDYTINVDWEKVEDANYYFVRLYSAGELAYESNYINGALSSYEIRLTDQNWNPDYTPVDGDYLDIRVTALMNEEGLAEGENELQGLSVSEPYEIELFLP